MSYSERTREVERLARVHALAGARLGYLKAAQSLAEAAIGCTHPRDAASLPLDRQAGRYARLAVQYARRAFPWIGK